MTYAEALAKINGLEGRPWRAGLDRMEAFVARAGLTSALSERGYIHIAGTNGKGTTTAFVESILRYQGWRAGAFFSPYVVDYRERIQAEGKMIAPREVVDLVERLGPVSEDLADTPLGSATKFEMEAAMGFAYWQEKRCDWVALEVGLGGRLDATNVVQPRACVITSIGLDHTAILGGTVQEIAAEKAGIIKAGIPVIVGAMRLAAENVIVGVARQQGSPCWRLGREIFSRQIQGSLEVTTPSGVFETPIPRLGGEAPPNNAVLALAACVAAGAIKNPSALGEGVRKAWLPGRFDRRTVQGREVVFDGAHNADAARSLVSKLGKRRIRLISNMLAGHEVAGFFKAFRELHPYVEVAPIDSPRALSVDAALTQIQALGISARGHSSLEDAMNAALREEELVVVTGSNYLVGSALRLFG